MPPGERAEGRRVEGSLEDDGARGAEGGILSREAVLEFMHRGLRLAAVLFVAEVATFFIIASVPFFAGEKQSYVANAKQLAQQLGNIGPLAQFEAIFANNIRVAMLELIPGLGTFSFGASIYETARVTQAIALRQNVPAEFLVAVLFILPHSWIELPAYALTTAEGMLIPYSAIVWMAKGGQGRMRRELGQLILTIVLATATLLVAAFFEVAEIVLSVGAFAMWVPFGLMVAALILLRGRLERPRASDEAAGGPPAPVQPPSA